MGEHAEALTFLAASNDRVHKVGLKAHEILVGEGCRSYVKTIYVGYEIAGQMIAALYTRADHLEIALALPEDAESQTLVDASHLTWRTLPVAAIVASESDLLEFSALAKSAAERVRSSQHDVLRDNEFFVRTRRERRMGSRQEDRER